MKSDSKIFVVKLFVQIFNLWPYCFIAHVLWVRVYSESEFVVNCFIFLSEQSLWLKFNHLIKNILFLC